MMDGDTHTQAGFNFSSSVHSLLEPGECAIDLFAGAGGVSEAIRQALGHDPDLAINHDQWAVGLHAANHPMTRHLRVDVWEANPYKETMGRPVGWLHGSPDCTDFSQAKGGQPRRKAIRSLTWVMARWAGTVRPRCISLENVKEILGWTHLVAKRDVATGRVVTLDMVVDPVTGKKTHRVADPGERVPVQNQFLVPDKKALGRTWRRFVRILEAMGYVVAWKLLKACDYGAGTSRMRLYMVARRDGEPIRFPEPTHGKNMPSPYVRAADCIDWSIPSRSIFTRPKPLADATLRRIARGIMLYVLGSTEPFIVPNNTNNTPKSVSEPLPTITTCAGRNLLVAPTLVQCANASSNGLADIASPLGTITAFPKGGAYALSTATLIQAAHGEGSGRTARRGSGAHDINEPVGTIHAGGGSFAVTQATLQPAMPEEAAAAAHLIKFRGASNGSSVEEPMPTITSGAGAKRPAGAAHAMGVITAFLEQANSGFNVVDARDVREPLSTITGSGSQQRLVSASLVTMRGDNTGQPIDAPLRTVSAGGQHHAVVEYTLSKEHEEGALRVAAFLIRYYKQGGQWGGLDEPLDTITTRDRLALVTVYIKGTPYVIVDIQLRMLEPHELFKAQGFPPEYIIDRTADGRRLTKAQQVRLCGNSVSPYPMAALIRVNLPKGRRDTEIRMAA